MSFNETIKAYFVTTGNSSNDTSSKASQEFAEAHSLLRSHVPEKHIRHIKASEGYELIASGKLTKKDVFVFDRFDGDFFQQLQLTKSLIVGTKCLLSCVVKCEPIPLGNSPVFTTAMRDLHISATGILPPEKERLRELIQWMGGYYFQNFGRSGTHLVSNTIKSTKYEHATLNGIPVMHVDWVQRVWERSCAAENILATDEEFDKYRLPIFFGTNITCTGLETEKKNEVMRLVNENGGTYHRAFRSQLVDIVITEKSKTDSDKYKAAVRCKKDILLPEWIFDSVEKGFALPPKAYQVKSLKVSTPTRTDQSIADFTSNDNTHLSDISRISVVAGARPNSRNNTLMNVNETLSSVTMNETQQQGTFAAPAAVAPSLSVAKDWQRDVLTKMAAGAQYRLVYDEICPKKAKKAGSFLDGCCIYLSGFRNEEREKLNRILNVGGATRYDVVNEKITHIIIGQLNDAEFRAWKKDGLLTAVNIVRLDWLLESIKLKQPANEVIYRVSLPTSREPDAPSPSSKRTLRSMNHSFKQPEKPIKKKLFGNSEKEETENCAGSSESPLLAPMATSTELPMEEDEHNLIAQYSQENIPAAAMPLPPTQNQTNNANNTTIAYPIASSTQLTGANVSAVAVAAVDHQPQQSEMTDVGMSIDYEHLNFFEGMTVYIDKDHFPEEFYTQMISECEAAQGNNVAATFKDIVDYAIVSFECSLNESQLPVKAHHIITELYVENCMKENRLVPIEYYHKHIPHTADAMPLRDMTIVISIYTGLERDYIDSIARLLGANVNKTFVKKQTPLLICPMAEGSKYEGAIKWRYPVVTAKWLVECAVQGKRISYLQFLVGESPEDFPISPKTLASTPAPEASNTAAAPTTATSTSDFTPLRNKRVSELAGPSRNSLTLTTTPSGNAGNTPESPHTPTNAFDRPSYNFDFMENILAEIENEEERECLREVIDEMRNNQTPELERIRRQACTPINRKIPTPKGIPEFCTTPEFEKRMADAFERRWRLPTKKMKPDTPIDEIRRRILRAGCRALNIPVSDDDEEQQQQLQATTSAKRTVSSSSNSSSFNAVATPMLQHSKTLPRTIFTNQSPSNMSSSNTSNTSAGDTLFVPATQTPNSSATGSGSRNSMHLTPGMGQRASLVGKSTINFDKISFEETEVGVTSATTTVDGSRRSAGVTNSPEIKQITDYLRNCESRKTMKRSASHGNGRQHQMTSTDMTETEAHYVQPFESEQFGVGTEEMVGWRDPAEFSIQRRSKPASTMQHKGTPRFSISSDDKSRDLTIEKILKLGGEVCENLVNYDPCCTHLVCERPNRGEKMLGCVSSGKWVLSLKYIEESYAKDVFIDEELYEWGNCKALNLPQLTQEEQVIAKAGCRWRQMLSAKTDNNCGAFTGYRALLHISDRNRDALKNVIKAGNGEIVEANPPYSEVDGAHLATHCFVDMRKRPIQQMDYEFLREHGVNVYTQMFINSHLMEVGDEDPAKYEIKM